MTPCIYECLVKRLSVATIAGHRNHQNIRSNFNGSYTAKCKLRQQFLRRVKMRSLPFIVLRNPYNKAHSVGPLSERSATSAAGAVKSATAHASGKRKVPPRAGSPFSRCS
jgi:hypothetical protein